jgi:sulfhydrogenase subunit alpha
MTHGHPSRDFDVAVRALARVEGEGGLRVAVRDGSVVDLALNIYEPPRFFEAFLRGRRAEEASDITARICGICPVAYQMSACRAVEDAYGLEVTGQIAELRRLLYCGEWIQSHALHVHLLHAPDFLGYQDAVALAEHNPEALARGLSLKKAGNAVMEVVGGRAVHPVNVRVGGFYGAPPKAAVRGLEAVLEQALKDALWTLGWAAGFDFPDVVGDYLFVALRGQGRYPVGYVPSVPRIVSSGGLDLTPAEFDSLVVEEHVERSTALHARLGGRDSYLTGPLARWALNYDLVSPEVRSAASEAGLGAECKNPFRSILVRVAEIAEACLQALEICRHYEEPDPPYLEAPGRAGTGWGATEAPRGLLLHRYRLNDAGRIEDARIVPPTAQNQISIEDDLRRVVSSYLRGELQGDLDALQWTCEQAVRNHDPCISCAAHFLDLEVVEE